MHRVPGAVRRDHQRDAQDGALGGVADTVEDELGEGSDPAKPRGVPARVDLNLQPTTTLAYVVLRGLEDQAAYVVLRPQHRSGHVIEPMEPEPAILVRRGQQTGRE